MQAVVQERYGSPDVLTLREVEPPRAGDGEVLIRVRAAGVDRGVLHLMTGQPYPVRVVGYGLRRPKTPIPGLDLAGVIEQVGPGVSGFGPGDEVFGIGLGAYAGFARASVEKLAAKPARLSFEQSAVLAISGLTALQGVRDHAKVIAGQHVLILGASGGVGTYAVQVAKAFGAEVTGVCSPSKVDVVRAIGADHVIDYTRDDVTAGGGRYDAILDIGGNRPLSALRRVLTRKGTLVIVGGETGGRWLGGTDRQLRAALLSPFISQRLTTFISKEVASDMERLAELVDDGQVNPVVDRSYPLSELPDALRYVDAGQARGKVVITMPNDGAEGPSQ